MSLLSRFQSRSTLPFIFWSACRSLSDWPIAAIACSGERTHWESSRSGGDGERTRYDAFEQWNVYAHKAQAASAKRGYTKWKSLQQILFGKPAATGKCPLLVRMRIPSWTDLEQGGGKGEEPREERISQGKYCCIIKELGWIPCPALSCPFAQIESLHLPNPCLKVQDLYSKLGAHGVCS